MMVFPDNREDSDCRKSPEKSGLIRQSEQRAKNAGIFREIVFVGVPVYGREQFHEKQGTVRFSR